MYSLLFTLSLNSANIISNFIREESDMPWFSMIGMILMWTVELTLFVLVVIVLVELIKFLKLKNAALKNKSKTKNEDI